MPDTKPSRNGNGDVKGDETVRLDQCYKDLPCEGVAVEMRRELAEIKQKLAELEELLKSQVSCRGA